MLLEAQARTLESLFPFHAPRISSAFSIYPKSGLFYQPCPSPRHCPLLPESQQLLPPILIPMVCSKPPVSSFSTRGKAHKAPHASASPLPSTCSPAYSLPRCLCSSTAPPRDPCAPQISRARFPDLSIGCCRHLERTFSPRDGEPHGSLSPTSLLKCHSVKPLPEGVFNHCTLPLHPLSDSSQFPITFFSPVISSVGIITPLAPSM